MTPATLNLPRPQWDIISVTTALHLGALLAFVPGTFSWTAVEVALSLYWITIGLGIFRGFHRLATHCSFRVPQWLEYILISCGSLAGQGAVMGWVGYHRLHHLHSDTALDPHDSTQGWWWCHIAWLMHTVPAQANRAPYIEDIANDRFYQFCHQYYVACQLGSGILLYLLGGWPFVMRGVFVRLFFGFHATCFVNSACHTCGYRTYETGDHSTNCWWVALMTYGEG